MSEVKVNKLSPRSGTTVTLGDSGDTFTIPSGVTLSNAGTITTGGLTTTGNISFGDNDKAIFGTGSDLDIFHNGTNSIIENKTGDLILRTPDAESIFLRDAGGNNLAQFNDNSGVNLYHNASVKIATTSTGALVTGRLSTSAGNASEPNFNFSADGNTGIFRASEDVIAFSNNGSETMRLNSTGLGIFTSSPSERLHVNGHIKGNSLNIPNSTTSPPSGDTIHKPTSNTIAFRTNSTERMRLTDTGLGINVTSPNTFLTVGDTNSGGQGVTNKTALFSSDVSTEYNAANNGSYGGITLANSDNTSTRTSVGINLVHGTSGVAAVQSTSTTSQRADLRFITRGAGDVVGQRMTIDNDGLVGIGTTSPSALLDLAGQFSDSVNTNLSLEMGNRWGFRVSTSANDEDLHLDANLSGTPFTCMTWDKVNGNVKIGAVSGATFTVRVTPSAGAWGIDAGTDGSSYSRIRISSSGTGTQTKMAFFNTNGEVGSITTAGTSTAFNTSSDYRLKENVSYDFDATTRLKQLKPARFNFIADADTTVDGFIAHEVSSVVPEAITGTKDAVDEDGNPKYQGIDQSKLVPLLVKTIQELEARITTLENA